MWVRVHHVSARVCTSTARCPHARSSIVKYFSSSTQHQQDMDLVNVSMRYLDLPEDFQKRVRTFHEYLWYGFDIQVPFYRTFRVLFQMWNVGIFQSADLERTI